MTQYGALFEDVDLLCYLTRRRRINAAAGAEFQPPSCRPRNYSRSAIRGPARLWRLRAQQHLRCLYVFAALLQPSCAAFTEGAGPSCCGCMTTPLAAAEHCCCGASAAWEAEPTTAAPDRQRRSPRTPVLAQGPCARACSRARRSVGPNPLWSPGLPRPRGDGARPEERGPNCLLFGACALKAVRRQRSRAQRSRL